MCLEGVGLRKLRRLLDHHGLPALVAVLQIAPWVSPTEA